MKEGRQNPPVKLLEEECEKAMRFSLMHMEALPQLSIEVKSEKVEGNVWRVSAAVENVGFLPSSSTQKAVDNRICAPVKAEICGGVVLQGESEIKLGHLIGRGASLQLGPYGAGSPGGRRKKAEWLIEAAEDTEITVSAKSERAGTVRQKLVLGSLKI